MHLLLFRGIQHGRHFIKFLLCQIASKLLLDSLIDVVLYNAAIFIFETFLANTYF